MPAEAAAALFQVITQRYLKGSVILTTNLGIASWGRIFDDLTVAAAMLDRLLHRSVAFNIDGASYRLRAHRARADSLAPRAAPRGPVLPGATLDGPEREVRLLVDQREDLVAGRTRAQNRLRWRLHE